MKFRRKGGALAVFCTEENEFPTTGFKPGDEVARMSIKTGKFSGATVAMMELHEEFEKRYGDKEEKYEQLIDEVIEDLKNGFDNGDYTVLDELLRKVPTKNLMQSLPEENWSKFKDL